MSKILTIEQAQARLEEKDEVIEIAVTVGDQRAVFFTDNSRYHGVNGVDCWVPMTMYFRDGVYAVEPRTCLPSGVVRNIEDYIKVFLYDSKIIQSEKELIDLIVKKKPYMAEVFQKN